MSFAERKATAEQALRSGRVDPERENGVPAKSDVWGCALGWQDALREEAETA